MRTFKEHIVEGDIKGPWKVKEPANDNGNKPDPKHFNKWHGDAITSKDGESETHTSAYESYAGHAEKHNVKPMAMEDFRQKMRNTGFMTQHIAGAHRFIGIKAKEYD